MIPTSPAFSPFLSLLDQPTEAALFTQTTHSSHLLPVGQTLHVIFASSFGAFLFLRTTVQIETEELISIHTMIIEDSFQIKSEFS